MRRIFVSAGIAFASLYSTASALAGPLDESENLAKEDNAYFGTHNNWVGLRTLYVNGLDARQPEGSQDYRRVLPSLGLRLGDNMNMTRFHTLLGLVLDVDFGWAPYESGPDGLKNTDSTGFNFRFAGGPSFAPIRWRGAIPGRLAFEPTFGWDYNPRRWLGSYVFVSVGGRLIIYPSESVGMSLAYARIPTVAHLQSVKLRSDEIEATFSMGWFTLGGTARWKYAETSEGLYGTQQELGGHVAIAF